MFNVLQDHNEYVIAYVEWWLVDVMGDIDKNGEYIYIKDLWVHPKYRFKRLINKLITLIDKDPISQKAKYVYWNREKYDDRLSRLFPRQIAASKGENRAEKVQKAL